MERRKPQTNKQAKAEAKKVQAANPGSILETNRWKIYVYFVRTPEELMAAKAKYDWGGWRIVAEWTCWHAREARETETLSGPGWYRQPVLR